jgi:DNA-binding transcriptional ArsR family regulator
MTKITLDRETFKALASDTRLDILKTLDGKNMGLNEIVKATNLNKATLHEHLTKLHGAGLIKRNERDGHKWVYYKLTWKGESLLHPENTKIVVLFTTTFVALWVGIIQLIWYIKGTVINLGPNIYNRGDQTWLMTGGAMKSLEYPSAGIHSASSPLLSSGFPDFFQNFLMRVKLANGEGILLNTNINVRELTMDPGQFTYGDTAYSLVDQSQGVVQVAYQNPMYLNIAVVCFILFTVVLGIAVLRFWENRTTKI